MKQCPYCGTEYEGKFCPECGAQWQPDKVCPQCQATLPVNVKFCTECGYAFTEEKRPQPPKTQKNDGAATLATLVKILCFVPAVLFTLFGALAFAFLAAPAIKANLLGMGGSENAYQALGDESISFMKASIIALIVFGGVAVLLGAYSLYRTFTQRRTKIEWAAYPVYLAVLIIASVMIGLIKKNDGGAGIFTADACETLFIVFSIVFALFSVGAVVGERLLHKAVGSVKEEKHERTPLDPPVPPEKVAKPPQ